MAESAELDIPETHVLAVASHVTSGYVGNTMATFCLQSLGCEVSAIHTVNYSNHVAYHTFAGRKTTPHEVRELYEGLKRARLADFDVLLSGYCPSAALVREVGRMGREGKIKGATHPGRFFWVLDPVMGDNGRIYVAEECVDAYRGLLPDADLILPNQFEAELLSGVTIRDWDSLAQAVAKLHQSYGLPHVVVTSVRLPPATPHPPTDDGAPEHGTHVADLSVIGSTSTARGQARLFRITIPAFPVFFSGTGDMFAALLVARLRESIHHAGLSHTGNWKSPDSVPPSELPLAQAVAKVLASMHAVLKDTATHYEHVRRTLEEEEEEERERRSNEIPGGEAEEERKMERHLRLTRAAEVRVVRNVRSLRRPGQVESFRAEDVVVVVPGEGANHGADGADGERWTTGGV